jgi:transcriptional regulator with XRE-family HTH domain
MFSLQLIIQIQTQEARIILAIKTIRISKKLSRRAIAKIYDIPETILYNKMNSRTHICEYRPGVSKLIELEKNMIVRNIFDIDTRGFAPRLASIKDIANYILDLREGKYIRKF